MNTFFINLMGGPCCGKSTMCAMIFSDLKSRGINCEMALEYAKDIIYEESFHKLSNQIYVFGKQHHRLFRLNGKVNVVITDSPLLNSVIYDKTKNDELKNLVVGEFKKLDTINLFIKRRFEYNEDGRVHTYDEALQKDEEYKELLRENDIPYRCISSRDIGDVIGEILSKLKNEKPLKRLE